MGLLFAIFWLFARRGALFPSAGLGADLAALAGLLALAVQQAQCMSPHAPHLWVWVAPCLSPHLARSSAPGRAAGGGRDAPSLDGCDQARDATASGADARGRVAIGHVARSVRPPYLAWRAAT